MTSSMTRNKTTDTVESLQRLGDRLAALERHVFEQDKEMLALSRQLAQLSSGLVGLRERLSEPSDGGGGSSGEWQRHSEADSGFAHAAERPPHY